jgi:hypothetical protein
MIKPCFVNPLSLAVIITGIVRLISPLCQFLDQKRINISVNLQENGLIWMHVRSRILSIPENITVAAVITVLNVLLVALEQLHHNIDLVSSISDDRGRANFGGNCSVPGVETGVDAEDFFGLGVFFSWLGLWWEKEKIHADGVRGPDHGLNVEFGPAVTCHTNKLDKMLAVHYKGYE